MASTTRVSRAAGSMLRCFCAPSLTELRAAGFVPPVFRIKASPLCTGLPWTTLAACMIWLTPAAAHHGALSSGAMLGSTGVSTRRAAPLTQLTASVEASHIATSDAAGDVLVASPGAEFAWSQEGSSGVNLPLIQLWPEAGAAALGLGNVGVFTKWTAMAEPDQVWLLDWQLALPSQNVHLGLDPGPVLGFGSSVLWSMGWPKWLLQSQLGVSGDARRAGTALELAASIRAVYWVTTGWGLSSGLGTQTRLITWCSQGGAVRVCDTGRASEQRTATSATAVTVEAALELATWTDGGLRASFRVPLSERRDAEWSVQVSAALGF